MLEMLKKAASPFVSFEEKAVTPVHQTESIPTTKPQYFSPVPQVNQEKFNIYFSKLMEDMNLPGPDYNELLKVIESDTFKKQIPDENSRILAGFTSLGFSGLTKEKALSSAEHYILGINQDKENFLKNVSAKQDEELVARDKRIADLHAQIESDQSVIQQKNKAIQDAQTEMSKLNDEKAAAAEKIKSNQAGYLAAADTIILKIQSHIQKIKTIL